MVRLWDGLNDKYAPPEVVRELARMALAAMDSEPVAFIDKQWTLVYFVPPMSMGLKIGDKLYRHAQQPVAPDESYKQLSELYHTQEKRLFKIAQRIKGPTFDKYSHLSSQAIDVLEAAIFGEDDTCRAAMLQAGNSPAIPDTWIPVSERIPIDFEAVIAFDGDQVYGEAMYSSDDGFTIDGYEPCDRLKLQNVTHWMPLPPPPKEVK
ncbi:DUF551 domain-containing protein [Klebsiella oxytoca]|nr:DUF551 domain-containing protein [Klebsiella oxytoca]MBG2693029.1 DUF551 domain-containing protein [Klebsiella oxytoca]